MSNDPLADRLQEALGSGYQVEQLLGSGGFAMVYLVRDLNLKRKLAVKLLSPDLITSKTVLERFRREAETVAQLSHPHIVPLHFIGQKDDLLYLAMQYIDGGSLADRIEREGRLPVTEVSRILREVASALDYAHRHGVIHRDIKPHNVLLESDSGRALLTDFGIARTAEGSSLTATGMLVGTPAYLSPEQVTGEASDHRADIYSLGVVAYEMAAGQPPFTAPTPTAVLLKRLGGPPPSLEQIRTDVPASLRRVIEGMLASDPAGRFQSAGDVVRALEGSPVALPIPQPAAGGKPARSKAVAVAGVVVLLLGIAAAGWSLLRPKTEIVEEVGPIDPDMVEIGGGEYTIGSNTGSPLSRPAHPVRVEPFGMDIAEVSVGQYLGFVNSGRVPAPWVSQPDTALPVTGVTYDEAENFCAWKHSPGGRLPNEFEWEAAARGPSGRLFPWGNSLGAANANTKNARRGGPAPVGSYPGGATPERVSNLVGNVWEWTSSNLRAYPGGTVPDTLKKYKVIRGGAFDTPDSVATATIRGYADPKAGRADLARTGFRCVMPERTSETGTRTPAP